MATKLVYANEQDFYNNNISNVAWGTVYKTLDDNKIKRYKPVYINPYSGYIDENKAGITILQKFESDNSSYPGYYGPESEIWFDKETAVTFFTQLVAPEIIYSIKDILEGTSNMFELYLFTNLNSDKPLSYSVTENDTDIEQGGTWSVTYNIDDYNTNQNFEIFTYSISTATGSLVASFTWGSDERVNDFTNLRLKTLYKKEETYYGGIALYNSSLDGKIE